MLLTSHDLIIFETYLSESECSNRVAAAKRPGDSWTFPASGVNNACEVVVTTSTPNGSAALPFVIPSEAEGSAVHSASATKVAGKNKFVIPIGA